MRILGLSMGMILLRGLGISFGVVLLCREIPLFLCQLDRFSWVDIPPNKSTSAY